MGHILSLILVLAALSMFVLETKKKFSVFLITIFCLNAIDLPIKIPMVVGPTQLVAWSFVISELKRIITFFKTSNYKIICNVVLIVAVGSIVLWINSPHFQGLYGMLQILKNEVLSTYMMLVFAIICIDDSEDLTSYVNTLYKCMVVLTIVGLANLLLVHNYYLDFALSTKSTINDYDILGGDKYLFDSRMRVSSMFFNAFTYGYVSAAAFLFFLYAKVNNLISKNKFYVMLICCGFGIMMCGSRTVLLCAIFGVALFVLFYYNFLKLLFVFLFLCVSIPVINTIFPSISEKLEFTMTAFDKDADVGGSSIELREVQYAAVLYWINGHELFGRGYDYAKQDLAVGGDVSARMDKDLHSLESVILSTLLEKGIFGLIVWASTLIMLIVYLLRKMSIDKSLSVFGVSLLAMFISFALATGELETKPITLLFVGMIISLHNKKNIEIANG